MKRRSKFVLPLLALACAAQVQAMEPETGVFAGDQPPDPYELAIQHALLADSHDGLCQMLAIPSFSEEWVVYMLRAEDSAKGYTVTSRKMAKHLWPEMLAAIEKQAPDPTSYRVDAESEAEALRGIHPRVTTRSAPLEAGLARRLDAACTQVLLRTRYPVKRSKDSGQDGTVTYERIVTIGADGETYHASHWHERMLLAGTTWTPEADSLDGDFVAMEVALQAYAEAGASPQATKALAQSIDRVEKHLSATARSPGPTLEEASDE